MELTNIRNWCLYSRKDPRFAIKGEGPMTASAVQEARRTLEEAAGCRAPDDLTCYCNEPGFEEEHERMIEEMREKRIRKEDGKMKTVKDYDTEMEDMRRRCDELGKKLDDTLVEMKALSIAVEKLKANVRYMQDGMI